MSRERFDRQDTFSQQGRIKSAYSATPNSFNPPLPARLKSPLPAINSQSQTTANIPAAPTPANHSVTTSVYTPDDEADLVLPTKVFQAKKTSVKDLSQALCSYLWFRRIKEIFLFMGRQNDAFTRFDMELARKDMIQTSEQYLENERPKGGGTQLVSKRDLFDEELLAFCRVKQSKIN